jgi:hypothetical protein
MSLGNMVYLCVLLIALGGSALSSAGNGVGSGAANLYVNYRPRHGTHWNRIGKRVPHEIDRDGNWKYFLALRDAQNENFDSLGQDFVEHYMRKFKNCK